MDSSIFSEQHKLAMSQAINRFNQQMELSGGKLTYDGNGKITRCKWSNVPEAGFINEQQIPDRSGRDNS